MLTLIPIPKIIFKNLIILTINSEFRLIAFLQTQSALYKLINKTTNQAQFSPCLFDRQ
jgi:hypothetical protein